MSLNEALRLQLATSGTPANSPEVTQGELVSETQKVSIGDKEVDRDSEKELSAKQTMHEERDTPTDTLVYMYSPHVHRGGALSGRSSPVKSRSRSHSPIKRPRSTPMLLMLRQKYISQSQAETGTKQTQHIDDRAGEEVEEDDDAAPSCPETPTPMIRAQRLQAYTPLGAPPKYHDRRSKSEAGVHSVHATSLLDRQEHLRYDAARTHVNFSERNFKPLLRDMVSAARIREHYTPAQTDVPTIESNRHVSMSAHSNVSGGTVTSQRSVFSTPGRDELERKKAMVEPDEGPFGRAVSVQDLAQRRRIIIGEVGDDEQRGKAKKGRSCGVVVGCDVM